MGLQLQIKEKPDYLVVKFIGVGEASDAWRKFELIAKKCIRANKNKLLLNFTDAHGEVTVADRYNIGNEAQIFFHYKLKKVALVDRPERLDSRRLAEKVMRNRWVNAHVFKSVEEAEVWLLT